MSKKTISDQNKPDIANLQYIAYFSLAIFIIGIITARTPGLIRITGKG